MSAAIPNRLSPRLLEARLRALVLGLGLLGLLAACTQEGSFSVHFSWEGGAAPAGLPVRVYMSAQVTAANSDAVLATAGPALYGSGGAIAFSDVPNGDNLIIHAQLRDAPGEAAQVLAYGLSQPFSLHPGKNVNVSVDVAMHPVIALPPAGTVPAIQVVTPNDSGSINSTTVALRLVAGAGTVGATLSNLPDLPAGSSATLNVATLTEDTSGSLQVPAGFKVYQYPDWNLDQGLPTPCTTMTGPICHREVYVAFTDANGVHSATASATVTVNLGGPILIDPKANPPYSGRNETVVVVATPSERLAAPPVPRVYAMSDPGMTHELPGYLTYRQGTEYTFEHLVEDSEPNGSYFVTFDLIDEAGNKATYGTDQSITFTVITVGAKFTNPGLNAVRFSAQPGYDLVHATFDWNSFQNLPPAWVKMMVGSASEMCQATLEDTNYHIVCDYPVLGDENEGPQPLVVVAEDLAGNQVEATTTVTLDFSPPSVVFANVDYQPARYNPLRIVQAATRGTTILVSVNVDEALDTTKGIVMVATDGAGHEVDLFPVGSLTANPLLFAGTVPTSMPDVTNVKLNSQITWTDVVGNSTSTASFDNQRIVLQTKAPAPLDTQTPRRIVYARVPWGSLATGGLPAYTVHGVAGAAAGMNTVIVYDSPDTGVMGHASELGRGPVNADGSFGVSLSRADHPDVAVVAVDLAGNVSTGVSVQDIDWTASFGGKTVAGDTFYSPHVLQQTPSFELTGQPPVYGGTLAQSADVSTEAQTYAALLRHDGNALSTSSATVWKELGPSDGVSPDAREFLPMSYDLARGVTVAFGGYGTSLNSLGDTWEWDGSFWSDVTPAGTNPPARSSHTSVYDAAHGVTLVFGGFGANAMLADTWAWDGVSWTELTPDSPGPAARYWHAMAYDSARGRTVLFGGCVEDDDRGNCLTAASDTWEWDGSTWTNVTPVSGESPPARYLHRMAYDAKHGVTLLFGGCSALAPGLNPNCSAVDGDLWAWNGTTWQQLTSTGATPEGRYGHGLVYDAAHGVTELFGGCKSGGPNGVCPGQSADLWTWDGTAWSDLTPAAPAPSPAPRFAFGLSYDSGRGVAVMFGGCNDTSSYECVPSLSDTWEWDGVAWTNATPDANGPSARFGHGLTFDTNRGVAVMFGGIDANYSDLNDTWEWSGSAWQNVTPASAVPPTRYGTALAYDARHGLTTLFGGCSGATHTYSCTTIDGDTWVWDGATWKDVTPAGPSPSARFTYAMAYDAARQVIVLFGGCGAVDSGGNCTAVDGDTWTWNGAAWTNVTPSGAVASPSPRFGHAMAYDATRGVTVLFGGCSDGPPNENCNVIANDTWEWNGTSWANVTPPGTTAADGRDVHAMAFDPDRGLIVRFGGFSDSNGDYLNDTAEWDGTSWIPVPQYGTAPSPRGWHAMTYDSVHHEILFYGGGDSGGWLNGTWAAASDTSARPAEIAAFSYFGLSASTPTVGSLTFTAYAGGVGNTLDLATGGSQVPGVAMAVWDGAAGGWKQVATNTSDVSSPTLLQYTATNSQEALQYLFDPLQTINVAVYPVQSRGTGHPAAQVAVDYVEVSMQYRP